MKPNATYLTILFVIITFVLSSCEETDEVLPQSIVPTEAECAREHQNQIDSLNIALYPEQHDQTKYTMK